MTSITIRNCWALGRNPRMLYEGELRRTFGRGDEYAAFTEIPYAASPEGLQRYQAPGTYNPIEIPGQPIPTYRANKSGKKSSQFDSPDYEGSSDCLYMNIYLPKDPADIKNPLPVLVYIHGGGFMTGSNSEEDLSPDFIVQHELVFVTINYRLGVLGFLNMGTEECPGNTGLKDQAKALEWIRDNIEGFKGDATNVTISGNSAGATCVMMHLISDRTKDLFHKAIVQSGGVYCPWGFKGHERDRRRMLAHDPEFLRLFRARDESKELHRRARYLLKEEIKEKRPQAIISYFGPTIEKFREDGFITDNPVELLKRVDHDKPVMAGITKEEGMLDLLTVDTQKMYKEWIKDDKMFCQFLMDNLRWAPDTAEKCYQEIRNKYFPNPRATSQIQKDRSLSNLFRDIYFRRFYDNFKFGPEETMHKNLFVYRFDHVSELSETQLHNSDNYHGATHGDEISYLYCSEFLKRTRAQYIYEGSDQNKEIEQVMNHMCSLWANFCKSGHPKSEFDTNNVEWRSHTEEAPCFLSIGKNLKLIEGRLYEEEWDWLNAIVNPEPIVESPASTPEDNNT